MIGLRLPPPPRDLPSLDADPAGVEAFASALLVASAALDDVGTRAAGPGRLYAVLGGVGAEAYRDGVVELGDLADARSLALRSTARRVDEHAGTLRGLDRDRSDLAHRHGALASARARLEAAVELTPPERLPELQARADALGVAVASYDVDASAWTTALDVEERAVVEALRRLLDVDGVERRWGARTDPADAPLAALPTPGSSPETVHDWWAHLTRREQLALVAAAPEAVGRLPGLPAWARGAANDVRLDRDLARLRALERQGLLTPAERRRLVLAEAAQAAREELATRTDPVTGEPVTVQLLTYDPDAFGGDGAVVVAVGDLDTAADVAILVPGLGTDATSVEDISGRAADLYDQVRSDDPGRTSSVVAWIGYDAPGDVGEVVGEGPAEAGGALLDRDVDGIRAAHEGAPEHVTVVGHSYGSTTVGHAAVDHGLDVDDVVLVGSPGAGGGTHHASDLGVGAEHVFVGADSGDPVATFGDDGWVDLGLLGGAGLGDNPATDDFGAIRFTAESGSPPGHVVAAHTSYFQPGSESLANIGHVVSGDYGEVVTAPPVHDPWWGPPHDPVRDRRVA